MRYLMLMGMVVMAFAGCTAPLREPDFTSPEETLLTFFNAFQNDEVGREYECFSLEFKEEVVKGLNLSAYSDVRQHFDQNHPILDFLLSMQEIEDNIKKVDRLGRDRATLTVTFQGEDYPIDFKRETDYSLEFDNRKRPIGDFVEVPLNERLRVEGDLFGVFLPCDRWTRENLESLKKVLVEKRWKILDIPFLYENKEISP